MVYPGRAAVTPPLRVNLDPARPDWIRTSGNDLVWAGILATSDPAATLFGSEPVPKRRSEHDPGRNPHRRQRAPRARLELRGPLVGDRARVRGRRGRAPARIRRRRALARPPRGRAALAPPPLGVARSVSRRDHGQPGGADGQGGPEGD